MDSETRVEMFWLGCVLGMAGIQLILYATRRYKERQWQQELRSARAWADVRDACERLANELRELGVNTEAFARGEPRTPFSVAEFDDGSIEFTRVRFNSEGGIVGPSEN